MNGLAGFEVLAPGQDPAIFVLDQRVTPGENRQRTDRIERADR